MTAGAPDAAPRTLFEKLWQRHLVKEEAGGLSLLYVDRHLVYEVTSPQAFEGLRERGLKPWRASSVLATCDHNVPTTSRRVPIADALSRRQVETLASNCDEFGIEQYGYHDPRQGDHSRHRTGAGRDAAGDDGRRG